MSFENQFHFPLLYVGVQANQAEDSSSVVMRKQARRIGEPEEQYLHF
jgi:hypothetical protein